MDGRSTLSSVAPTRASGNSRPFYTIKEACTYEYIHTLIQYVEHRAVSRTYYRCWYSSSLYPLTPLPYSALQDPRLFFTGPVDPPTLTIYTHALRYVALFFYLVLPLHLRPLSFLSFARIIIVLSYLAGRPSYFPHPFLVAPPPAAANS